MNLLNTVMSRRSYPISPWLEMFETEIRTQEDMQLWHTIKPFDYVTALVETSCGKIALVKQLRAVRASVTTEFPGGLLDRDETPEECIRREIKEEVGLEAGQIIFLAEMIPDTGRLENRLFAFYVRDCVFSDKFKPEKGLTPIFMGKKEFESYVLDNHLLSAINMSILGHAIVKGYFKF